MAIQHRALVALSIAFTASIVAFADFAPGIPQVRYLIVGRLILAFLLPVAATVIWWLFVALHRSARQPVAGSISASERIGPVTVLFLSAFHVTMLVALIGPHLWLGRVLGLMVGVFFIATGNELPRLRPNPAWRIGTSQTVAHNDLWRRVHRLGGYIRVTMGIGLCVAALSSVHRFEPLIVIAVCLETAIYLGASIFFARHRPLQSVQY